MSGQRDFGKLHRDRGHAAVETDRRAVVQRGLTTMAQRKRIRTLAQLTDTNIEGIPLVAMPYLEANELIGYLEVVKAQREKGK